MTGSPPGTGPAAVWWLPALRDPAISLDWSLAQWQEVLRQTRRLRLLL